MVEARVPVPPGGGGRVDVAGERAVHERRRALGRAGRRAREHRHLEADRPVRDERAGARGGEDFRVRAVARGHRQIPRPVLRLAHELDEELALAVHGQGAGRGVQLRGQRSGRLVAEHLRDVVRGDRHREAGARGVVGDDEAVRVRRPRDEIPVVLERPHDAHRVGRLPVDVGLPRHRHVQRAARRLVGRRDGVDLAVELAGELLAARRGELLQVGRVGVVGVDLDAVVGDALEVGDVPAAADGTQLRADRHGERVHGGRRDLDDDGGHEAVFRLRVVVAEDELPLRTVDLARGLVHEVARGEHVRRGGVVVEAPDDVGRAGAVRLVARRDDRRITEEAHEASREVDERRAVALVAARREEAIRTLRRRRREGVEARDLRAVLEDERDLHRARARDQERLGNVRRPADHLDAAVGERLRFLDGRVGLRPVDVVIRARIAREELADFRVRRLLRDHAADRPGRERPGRGRGGRARGRVRVVCPRAGGGRRIRRRRRLIVGMAEHGDADLLHADRAVGRGVRERRTRRARRNHRRDDERRERRTSR